MDKKEKTDDPQKAIGLPLWFVAAALIALVLALIIGLRLYQDKIKNLEVVNKNLKTELSKLEKAQRFPVMMPMRDGNYILIYNKAILRGVPVDKTHLDKNQVVRMIVGGSEAKEDPIFNVYSSQGEHFCFFFNKKALAKGKYFGLQVLIKKKWIDISSQ